jgi:hypothetical protein
VLLRIANDSREGDNAHVATLALAKLALEPEQVTPILDNLLNSTNKYERRLAVEGLLNLGRQTNVPTASLQKALIDADEKNRVIATNVVMEIAPNLLTNSRSHH